MIKTYDDKKNQVIIHIIYLNIIIQKHMKSFISMLITKLKQKVIILRKSWMRKHEMSYHEKTNTIKFTSEFCTHSKEVTKSNKKKIFFSRRNLFWINQLLRNSKTRERTRRKSFTSRFCFEKTRVWNNQILVVFEKIKMRHNFSAKRQIWKKFEISSQKQRF